MSVESLIAELKRRRVFRVLVGYGIVSFAVLQVVEPIMHGLSLPDSVLKIVVVLLGIGFPIAVVLGWAFDVNAGSIERTPPAESFRGARLAVLLVGIGLGAAAPGIAWYLFLRPAARAPAVAAETPSIAVLPFENLSSDKEQEYLSEGIAEEITAKLSRLKGLAVAARTSVARFKGAAQSPSEIGAALGVSWLLEGSVRRAGDRIRVTTTLLKSVDGFRVWSDDAEAKLDDIFAVQERIAARTVDALALKLTPAERRSLADWGTSNAAAYDEYLRGQMLYEDFQKREQFEASIGHFKRALDIDPRFAPALAGYASVEAQYYRDFDSDPVRLARAEEMANRALAIDPHLARALIAIGEIRVASYDYAGAAEKFAQVTVDDPQNYFAFDLLCWAQGYRKPPLAVEAEQACRRSLALNPGHSGTHYHLARALLIQGKTDEAAKAVAILQERQGSAAALVQAGRFWLALYRRQPREAIATFGPDITPLNRAWKAMAHAQLGELDAAFAELEQAVAGGYRDLPELHGSEWFAPLRNDPRFEVLLKKHGL